VKNRSAISWDKGKLSKKRSAERLISLFEGFQGKMNNVTIVEQKYNLYAKIEKVMRDTGK